MALLIASEGEQQLNIVDTVLHPIHLERPEWCAAVDSAPDHPAGFISFANPGFVFYTPGGWGFIHYLIRHYFYSWTHHLPDRMDYRCKLR